MTRTLILMRHGKSGYPDGVDDHDRPLAARGQYQAGLAGEWIRANVGNVDAAICSTALRTRETLAATEIDAPVRYENAVYGGSPEDILGEITLTDSSVRSLLVVGHAPGTPWTALELADNPDSDEATWIRTRFPTSGLAVLTTESSWADLSAGRATLIAALRAEPSA
ncbi:SixA phosphatase family protein [Actinomycetes bacterium M1A6_2h]